MAAWKLLLAAIAVVLLLVHVLFVALLRKTSFSVDRLTIPDLCHTATVGEAVVEFQNPSYCTPEIGPLNVTLVKNDTALLRVTFPRFDLQSGVSTLVADVNFHLLASPRTLHDLVFADDRAFEIAGGVPIRVRCLLVPFTINVDIGHVSGSYFHSEDRLSTLSLPRSSIINDLKQELQRVVSHVLKTIVLSNFHVDTFADEIFAFTDVSFNFASPVSWNIPSLALRVQSAARQTILVAGMKRFLLGGGNTFISAYSEVFKNQAAPLQKMLETYLTGEDVTLHVSGRNPDTECYSLQVLDMVDVKVDVPAKIDGKPALLRHYEIHPKLKELDSTARKCLLELRVLITLYNPLPIRFDLFKMEFDLLYKETGTNETLPAELVTHILNATHVEWGSHEQNNVTLFTQVREFDVCKQVIGLYLQNHLSFEIQRGGIAVGAAGGNFSVPFSVTNIPIHPDMIFALNDTVASKAAKAIAAAADRSGDQTQQTALAAVV